MNALLSKLNFSVRKGASSSWFHKIASEQQHRFPGTHNHEGHDGEEDETYYLAFLFEVAVEVINSVAGIIILCACILAGLNMILVALNSVGGFKFNMLDPLHDQDKATLLRVRQTLGEQVESERFDCIVSVVLLGCDVELSGFYTHEAHTMDSMGFLAKGYRNS
jgi:hypothetical protein